MRRFLKYFSGISLLSALFFLVFIGIFGLIFGIANSFLAPSFLKVIIPKEIVENLSGAEISWVVFILIFSSILLSFFISYLFSIRHEYIIKKLSDFITSSNGDLQKKTIENINDTKDESIKSINGAKANLEKEISETQTKILSFFNENIYHLNLLNKDLSEADIVFVYGHMIYLSDKKSNTFIEKALEDKYWIDGTNKYFIILMPQTKINNLFKFIWKIKHSIKTNLQDPSRFNHFYLGIIASDKKEIPTPVQVVNFINLPKDITLHKIEPNQLERICLAKRDNCDYYPTFVNAEMENKDLILRDYINYSLIFSNDLLNDSTKLNKDDLKSKTIGFKINIEGTTREFEILHEFDELIKSSKFFCFQNIIGCCLDCPKVESEGSCEHLIDMDFSTGKCRIKRELTNEN